MKKINNNLYLSLEILMKPPYNLKYGSASVKLNRLKKEKLLYKIENNKYLYIPTLNKYLLLYWFNILWHFIMPSYIWLFSSAKKYWLVKQENNENIMYIGDTIKYKEYNYNYDKFKTKKYIFFKAYKNALEFWIYSENNIIYSDLEKTILDLIYYSLYSKYIKLDYTLLEKTNKIDHNKIKQYIQYYPNKSQVKILNKFNNIFL